MTHKYSVTTDGTKRPICMWCGKLQTEIEAKSLECPDNQGLLTTVWKEGVQIYNLWKAIQLEKELGIE